MSDITETMAKALGLPPYQLRLLEQLAEQAERQGIAVEDLAHLARGLDRIDWEAILVDTREAAAILGVTEGHIGNLASAHQEWMAPLLTIRAETGKAVSRLWLRAKVEEFGRLRRAGAIPDTRLRRTDEDAATSA